MRGESWVASAAERIDEGCGCWLSCLARVVDSLNGQHSYYLPGGRWIVSRPPLCRLVEPVIHGGLASVRLLCTGRICSDGCT